MGGWNDSLKCSLCTRALHVCGRQTLGAPCSVVYAHLHRLMGFTYARVSAHSSYMHKHTKHTAHITQHTTHREDTKFATLQPHTCMALAPSSKLRLTSNTTNLCLKRSAY